MNTVIQSRLKQLEKDHNVEVLYAVESGSRAWGFSSHDSDWDVRFIYKRPVCEYLRMSPLPDTIESIEGDLDLSGWDLKKTLGLLYKSNPPLLEWLRSPFVYQESPEVVQELRSLSTGFYSANRTIHHYYHTADHNFNSYIAGRDEVKKKKYLYILRPLLACTWIEWKGTMPPMEMEKTLDLLKGQQIWYPIRELIELKRAGDELGMVKPIIELNQYIGRQLDYYHAFMKSLPKAEDPSLKPLDDFFLKQVYGKT
jgi:predicted nucleotidyltransferase